MVKKVAIQGVKGSFHHIVAQQYFGKEILVEECLSFQEVVSCILNDNCDAAIMAIENSIAGSIIPNYALIDENDLKIVGEYYLDIQQNLMALEGQNIADIQTVYSHPMALLQCRAFFKNYPHIRLVEDVDTAESARRIQEKKLKGVGAVASTLASELFHLPILFPSIQTIKNNQTRFVIINKSNGVIEEKNKVSLKFELSHVKGSLAAVLNVISDCGLNLTKIQSLPKIDTPWKYNFFVDLTFSEMEDFEKAEAILKIMTEDFKIFGTYKNART